MNEQIDAYLQKYSAEIIDLFRELRNLVYKSVSAEVGETMWAKMPSYYVGEAFVRLIPFNDHINIEAQAVSSHEEELKNYKITPKGMLQIYTNQQVPTEIIQQIFGETLD